MSKVAVSDSVAFTYADSVDNGKRVFVNRPVYDYSSFNLTFPESEEHSRTCGEFLCDQVPEVCCCCGVECCECDCDQVGKCVFKYAPLLNVFRKCTCGDIISDLLAGISMFFIHIPQGLAYGLLAGINPIHGLYTACIPALLFAFFSSSRHVSIGTFALMSVLLSDVLARHYKGYLTFLTDSNRTFPIASNSSLPESDVPTSDYVRLQLIVMATFICAIINFVLGFFRLGMIAVRLLSGAMLRGFTTAVAVHIVVILIPYMLGISPERTTSIFRLFGSLDESFRVIGTTNWITVVVFVVCFVILLFGKETISPFIQRKIRVPIPVEVLVLIGGLLFSYFSNAGDRFDMEIIGHIEPGFPAPFVPDFSYMHHLILDTILLAVIGATVTISIAKTYANEYEYEVDSNQEFVSLGLANFLGCFFQSFYAVGGMSRTAVVASVGMISQIASIISSLLLILVIIFLGRFFESVPHCVLAAIVLVSLKHLFVQVKELRTIWNISKLDFLVWTLTALVVLIFDIIPGLLVGFLLAVLLSVLRSQRPQFQVLGRMDETEVFEDVRRYSSAKEIPGVKIIRFEGAISFLNADLLRDVVNKEILSHRHRSSYLPLHTIIFDASSWTFIDSAGLKCVAEIYKNLVLREYRVLFSCIRKTTRSSLADNRFISDSVFFPTTQDAVIFAITDSQHCFVDDSSQRTGDVEILQDSLKLSVDEKKPLLGSSSGKLYG